MALGIGNFRNQKTQQQKPQQPATAESTQTRPPPDAGSFMAKLRGGYEEADQLSQQIKALELELPPLATKAATARRNFTILEVVNPDDAHAKVREAEEAVRVVKKKIEIARERIAQIGSELRDEITRVLRAANGALHKKYASRIDETPIGQVEKCFNLALAESEPWDSVRTRYNAYCGTFGWRPLDQTNSPLSPSEKAKRWLGALRHLQDFRRNFQE